MTDERKLDGRSGAWAVLEVRIDEELEETVRRKAEEPETDESTFVRWCILTGLFLGDLNAFVCGRFRRP